MLELNKIYNTDALSGFKMLPDKSVSCIICSPPYWGLRGKSADNALGQEDYLVEYVNRLVEIFREGRRALRDDGVFYLNLGDSYANYANSPSPNQTHLQRSNGASSTVPPNKNVKTLKEQGFKNKDLIGVPWETALALRRDGWYLRQDCIWNKSSVMPESVVDRFTRDFEYIFLFSKQDHYYFDWKSVQEEALTTGGIKISRAAREKIIAAGKDIEAIESRCDPTKRRCRAVWRINSNSDRTVKKVVGHHAMFPCALVERMLLSGCPEGGIVVDPFMGLGTTGLTAKKFNRNYIGFEINPEFAKVAQERIDGHITEKLLL